MKPKASLLLDIGNSRLKALPLAALDSGSWQASLSQSDLEGKPFAQALDEALDETLRGLFDDRQGGWADELAPTLWATGGRHDAEVEQWCHSRRWPLLLIHASESWGPLSNGYDRPEALGSDRWLAMIAAMQLAPLPLVVADAGTALTVDVLLSKGGGSSHAGGLILPGLKLSRQSLEPYVGNTVATEVGRDSSPSPVGRSTAEGIEKGTLLAACSAIAALVTGLRRRHGSCSLLFTGGDGAQLAQMAELQSSKPKFEPQLPLRGLALRARAAKTRL